MEVLVAYSAKHPVLRMSQSEKSILFGRDEVLVKLNSALSNVKFPMLVLTGEVGSGKTALMQHWLWQYKTADRPDFDAVLRWSFSGYINEHDPKSELHQFLEYALIALNVAFSTEHSCLEKVMLLVKQLQQQRVLLILDHVFGAMFTVERSDHHDLVACFDALLMPLMRYNPGCCVLVLDDPTILVGTRYVGAPELRLERLSQVDGVKLLMHRGVSGKGNALAKVSALFECHPLTLTLLVPYLRDACGGDLTKLDTIPVLFDQHATGRHTRRILAAYEKWLMNTPELAMVYLFSLFAGAFSTRQCLDYCHVIFRRQSLFVKREIPSILAPLSRLNDKKLLNLQQHLQELCLVTAYREPEMFEMHPVIREYFAQKFRTGFWDEWVYLRGILLSDDEDHDIASPVKSDPIRLVEERLMQAIVAKHWSQAADSALQLHQYALARGNVDASINYARQSVAYAHLGQDTLHLQQNLHLLTALLQQVDATTSEAMSAEVAV